MLKLSAVNETTNTAYLANLPADAVAVTPETVNLKLLMWDEGDEVFFTYGPSHDVVFKKIGIDKVLDIELISRDNTPDLHQFWISHYTVSATRNLKNIECARRDRDQNQNVADIVVPHASIYHSEFGQKVTRLKLFLQMDPGDSFYLNIIAKGIKTGHRMISCDPQVENGTKT